MSLVVSDTLHPLTEEGEKFLSGFARFLGLRQLRDDSLGCGAASLGRCEFGVMQASMPAVAFLTARFAQRTPAPRRSRSAP